MVGNTNEGEKVYTILKDMLELKYCTRNVKLIQHCTVGVWNVLATQSLLYMDIPIYSSENTEMFDHSVVCLGA